MILHLKKVEKFVLSKSIILRSMVSEYRYKRLMSNTRKLGTMHLSQSYDRVFSEDPGRWANGRDELDSYVLKKIGLSQSDILLDVGYGNGILCSKAHSLGAKTFGLDFSAAALNLVKENSPQTTRVQADGCYIPFETASFDKIVSVGSLEHFLDPAKGVREMRRVVKPNGCVLILVPDFSLRDKVLGIQEYELIWSEKKMAKRHQR